MPLTQRLVISVILLGLAACAAPRVDQRVGLYVDRGEGGRLVAPGRLSPGKARVIVSGESPGAIYAADISERIAPDSEDEATYPGGGVDVRRARLGDAPPEPRIGIAVLDDGMALFSGPEGVLTDMDGDGLPERLEQCLGGDGAHFALIERSTGRVEVLWRAYRTFGRDVAATCPPSFLKALASG